MIGELKLVMVAMLKDIFHNTRSKDLNFNVLCVLLFVHFLTRSRSFVSRLSGPTYSTTVKRFEAALSAGSAL